MKRIFSIIISGVLLAACSTSQKVANKGIFQKRKYTKGIFLDMADSKKHAGQADIAKNINRSVQLRQTASEEYLNTKAEPIKEENNLITDNNINTYEVLNTDKKNTVENFNSKFKSNNTVKINIEKKKEIKKVTELKQTDKSKVRQTSIDMSEKKLLMYAIIFFVAALIIWLLGWFFYPFWWVAYILSVIGLVFFVLWLLKAIDAV